MVAMMGSIMLSPVLLVAVLNFGTSEAQEWLNGEYETHKVQLAALEAGTWPDSPASARIAALAERLGPEAAERIRGYWKTQAYLVVEAEETMIEESEGDAKFDRKKITAAFAERDRYRRELGKSAFAALARILPFSRNDLWEVGELRQRVMKNG